MKENTKKSPSKSNAQSTNPKQTTKPRIKEKQKSHSASPSDFFKENKSPKTTLEQSITQSLTQAAQQEDYESSLKFLIISASKAETDTKYMPAKLALLKDEELLLKAVRTTLPALQAQGFKLLEKDIEKFFGISANLISHTATDTSNNQAPNRVRALTPALQSIPTGSNQQANSPSSTLAATTKQNSEKLSTPQKELGLPMPNTTPKPTVTLSSSPHLKTLTTTSTNSPLAPSSRTASSEAKLLEHVYNLLAKYKEKLQTESLPGKNKQHRFDFRLGLILRSCEKQMEPSAKSLFATHLINCCRSVIKSITETIKSEDDILDPIDKKEQFEAIKLLAWCYANADENNTISSPYRHLHQIYTTFINLDQCEIGAKKEKQHKKKIKSSVYLALQNLIHHNPTIIKQDTLLHFFVETIDMVCDTIVQYDMQEKAALDQTPIGAATVKKVTNVTDFIREKFPRDGLETRIIRIKAIIENYYPQYRDPQNFATTIAQMLHTQGQEAKEEKSQINIFKQGTQIIIRYKLRLLEKSCLQELIRPFITRNTVKDKKLHQNLSNFFKELKEPILISWHFYQYALTLKAEDKATNSRKQSALLEAINLYKYNTSARLELIKLRKDDTDWAKNQCLLVLKQPLKIKPGLFEAKSFYAHRAQAAEILISLSRKLIGKKMETPTSRRTTFFNMLRKTRKDKDKLAPSLYMLLSKAYNSLQQSSQYTEYKNELQDQSNRDTEQTKRLAPQIDLFYFLSDLQHKANRGPEQTERLELVLTAYIHLGLIHSTNAKIPIKILVLQEAEHITNSNPEATSTAEQSKQLIIEVLNLRLPNPARFRRRLNEQQKLEIQTLKLAYLKALLDWSNLNPKRELPSDCIAGFREGLKPTDGYIKQLIQHLERELNRHGTPAPSTLNLKI